MDQFLKAPITVPRSAATTVRLERRFGRSGVRRRTSNSGAAAPAIRSRALESAWRTTSVARPRWQRWRFWKDLGPMAS